jgi:hypothetical protein
MNVSATCRDVEVLLSLRAAGGLEPSEAARVDDHLAVCGACRAVADEYSALLDLARLPPPRPAEQRMLAALPQRVRADVNRAAARRLVARPLAILAGAAAAAALLVGPLPWTDPQPHPSSGSVVWQEPDIDGLWEETDVLELEGAATESASTSDAALAAVDAEIAHSR